MSIPQAGPDAVLIGSLMATGLMISFLHAALPTHWLPFVIAARARKWSISRTLWVNLTAGIAHAFFTAFLGAGIAWLGWTALEHSIEWFPYVISAAVFGVGAFMIFRWWRGKDPHPFGHHHGASCHHELPEILTGEHHHDHAPPPAISRDGAAVAQPIPHSDRHVIAGLIALVTLSPCETFLPVYLAGAPAGLYGFAALTLTLTIGTILGMLLLTWVTLHAAKSAPFERLARHEGLILGTMLVALSVGMLVLEH